MGTVTSTLDIILKDDVSANAARITAALDRTEAKAKELDAALSRSTMRDKMKGQLTAIGANTQHVDALNKKWEEFSKAQGLAAKASDWTKAQTAEVQRWESVNKAAIKAVMGEERAHEAARIQTALKADQTATKRAQALARAQEADAARERRARVVAHAGGAHGGDNTLMGLAGVYVGHQFLHGAHKVLERYQDFDNQRRYAKAVMGLTDEQQEPLVQQALKGGATSRFNDIQWLESQREFAARGYNVQQVMGFTPVAATLATAFDKTMPESVRLIEGAMLGFGKDASTFAKAMDAAGRTADLQVKASKSSGMTAEDIEALYKYGAAPAKMAGLSEERMLAFGALLKKNNMGGDEAGTAFRALAKTLVSPTAGGMVAMRAAGIDWNKYQKAPTALDANGFTSMVAQKYGVQLSAGTQKGLAKIFADPKMLGDASKFTPAVVQFLQGALGGKDAKSLKSIAGLARDFRSAAAGGVDTMALMGALMEAMGKNRNLANAMFGSKQGGRIFAALGDPEVYNALLDQITNHSAGYAHNVATERSAGFDGAVKQLQGSIATLESSIGRAWDGGGKGGILTDVTRAAAGFATSLSEANPKLLQAGTSAAAIAAAFLSMKGAGILTGGFGLKASATALDAAAAHLMEVGSLGKGGLGGGAGESGLGEGAKGGKKLGFGRVRLGALVANAIPTLMEAYDYSKMSPEERAKFDEKRAQEGHEAAAAAGNVVRSVRDKLGLRDALPFSDDNRDEGNEPSIRARGATMQRNARWHAHVEAAPAEDPYLGGERQAIDERARRSAAEFRRDPEAARGRAMMSLPQVDTTGLDQAKQKADEAHAAIEGLNTSVAPQVSLASLDALIAKANEARAALAGLGGAAAAAGSASRTAYRAFNPASAGRTTV